jgi:hypothetical protein
MFVFVETVLLFNSYKSSYSIAMFLLFSNENVGHFVTS